MNERLRHHAHDLAKGARAAVEGSFLDENQKALALGLIEPAAAWLSRLSDILDPVGSSCSTRKTPQPGALRGRHGERVE